MTDTTQVEGVYGSDLPESRLREAFLDGEFPVAVYGLGKMGLPIAATFADVCGRVIGADVDTRVVAAIERGQSHVEGEPGLDDLVADTVDRGALRATDEPVEAAEAASIHVVVVPTLLDGDEPDLSALSSAVESIAVGLAPGDLVLVESTVPPRTCEDVLEPHLASESGVTREEFGVAFCPERTSSGRALQDIRSAYPKVVGGTDDEATHAAATVYDQLTENAVVETSGATTAEAVKVFGGVYRDVNIALANEFARYADEMGIDVREAIAASNTQPFSNILDPGPGVGGHCIPVYPYFLYSQFDVDGPLVPAARALNDDMPAYTVDRLVDELAVAGTDVGEATVLLLGATYRGGVAETRNSPAVEIAELLADYGSDVLAVDPMVDEIDTAAAELVTLAETYVQPIDAVVLVTDHDEFAAIEWRHYDDLVVLDGRDALELSGTDHRYCSIGDGQPPQRVPHWHRSPAPVAPDGGSDD